MGDRNLRDLLAPLGISAPYKFLRRITLDSRQVAAGDLFVAVKGNQTHGREYISQAISQGVSAILTETEEFVESGTIQYVYGVPVIYISNLSSKVSFLAGEFYKHPALSLHVIGVTGTNGKTTITQLIAQWAKRLGEISAVMGTMGNGILGNIVSSTNTTGSATEVQAELRALVDKQVTLVAMEVSSHSLIQNRVAALQFTAVVFANLSRDHLDYHSDMQSYAEAKLLLFTNHISHKQIINIDDDVGLRLLTKLNKTQACAVSVSSNNLIPNTWLGAWLCVEYVNYYNCRTIIHFNSIWGNGTLESPLIGTFNVHNIMLAMATFLMIGYPLEEIIKTSTTLQPICGRMEIFSIPKSEYPTVIIDYAHTPDALEKVLIAIRLHFYVYGSKSKLWCVFGCGGDRDRGKRALMGSIAEKYADLVIITEDNPRSERPTDIINDILMGFIKPDKAITIVNRAEAVTYAVMQANVNDVILVAGKGHENYQIIGNIKIDYSDRMTVARLFGVIV